MRLAGLKQNALKTLKGMALLNLKQKAFFFVALSVTALLVVYLVFSNYYIGQQENQFLEERSNTARAIAEEFTDFLSRGVERLQTVAGLPGLVYGLQTLEQNREGKQITAWGTLHYLLYESDVFTDGVYLVNDKGKVIWSEPPDVDLIETAFPPYDQIVDKLKRPSTEVAFLVWQSPQGTDMLIAAPLNDGGGRSVGTLVGKIPVTHPVIQTMLHRNPVGHGVTQLVDETGLVIASTDPLRQLHRYAYPDPPEKAILVEAHASPSLWTVIIDQDTGEAMAGIRSLKNALTAFGIVLILIAMGSLLFILRSFTRPVELLTEAARRIGDGDFSGGFTLHRSDEIGVLAKTLDDMKTKLKSSYDLLFQSEKMALMGQIVAGIAHELNNPLTIVVGNVQLLMMRERNEKNVQSLTRIKDGAERASKIVKNLLTFARQERPERKPTDINTILRKTLDLRAYELRVNNVEMNVELAPDLPETMADPHQLQQVFLNLIVNAEHAMIDAHGKGLLRISTRAENGKILAFFSDDGPGISSENVRRIFEPFFTTKPVGKGTGLGLSICQGIIGEHGGKLEVESTLGRGTTFIVEVPIQRWTAAPPPAIELARPPSVSRKKILVIDDEPQIRQLLEDLLYQLGHVVETAANGGFALDLLEKHAYDLIISDVKMPELSGPEFYAALKRKGSALERRVVFLTGDLMNAETLQFVENTGCAWLRKPFDIDSITRTISDCLNENVTIGSSR